jgi:hypothetical protein
MIDPMLAARLAIAAAALALVALAAVHILKNEIHPWRSMVSRYALGRHGWVMALCFAALAVGSACLSAALITPPVMPPHGRIGLILLLAAAVALTLAARFPMDPASTPPAQMSWSGRIHSVAFMVGVPSQVFAVLLLSLVLRQRTSHAALPLLTLTAVVWATLIAMLTIMTIVGPGKPPNPAGPERFLGFPNRLFLVAYGVWLMAAAWPFAR